jgi:hypothetical protein
MNQEEVMTILYVIKSAPDETLGKIISVQREGHEVSIHDIRNDSSYLQLIEKLEQFDKVISW